MILENLDFTDPLANKTKKKVTLYCLFEDLRLHHRSTNQWTGQ